MTEDQNLLIGSFTRTKAILETYQLRANKRFGQNFLTDLNILNGIVAAAEVGPQDNILEIGPGIGSLTELLAKSAKTVTAYEIDDKLIPVLADVLSPYKNVEIVHQDVLKADLSRFKGVDNLKVVANLPYYITTPILMQLIESDLDFELITVMMQKEVAQRIQAGVGSKDYGELSLVIQYKMNAKIALQVPRTAFFPSPNVDSAVLNLSPLENFTPFPQEKEMFQVIKASFAHRRKTLVNNLMYLFGQEQKPAIEQAILESGFDLNIRGERLNLQEFQTLTTNLLKNNTF
ncbi:MAG: 16S rRNA (adenine(1518)-N(6)/adenine(1519)-N(6))-dimethyltransferase RsmA [Lactobacillaceae bacterium]|jgi:16S rRNA (adenine1518-N6/adenine1519-N6)-dimethyltransferase|nr:16S rRNA (adenine(1518)-N(6)/adenine(1519)-N(6))-dimethyltransferase RsmA [Lactobacillaceae bacterium]